MQCTFIMRSPKVFIGLARFFFTRLLGVCMMGSSVATDIYFYRFYFSSEIRSICRQSFLEDVFPVSQDLNALPVSIDSLRSKNSCKL